MVILEVAIFSLFGGSGSIIVTPPAGVSHGWEEGDWLLHIDGDLKGLDHCTQHCVSLWGIYSNLVWSGQRMSGGIQMSLP